MLTRRSPRRTYRQTGPASDVVEVVLERASRDGEPHCEVCGDPVRGTRGVNFALHHRKGRGLPDSHLPQNLILVHGASNVDLCHGRIHSSRTEAQASGWSVSRNTLVDPLYVAILIDGGGRWVYLSAEGSYVNDPG
jgi:hypothetical protein